MNALAFVIADRGHLARALEHLRPIHQQKKVLAWLIPHSKGFCFVEGVPCQSALMCSGKASMAPAEHGVMQVDFDEVSRRYVTCLHYIALKEPSSGEAKSLSITCCLACLILLELWAHIYLLVAFKELNGSSSLREATSFKPES